MRRTPIIVLAIFIVCVGGAFVEWLSRQSHAQQIAELESYDHRDGKKEAETDIARGIFKWKIAGRVGDYEVRSTILRERLGTQLDWFDGCDGSAGRTRYIVAYNSTVRSHLAGIFGESAVFAVLGEAPSPPRDDEKG